MVTYFLPLIKKEIIAKETMAFWFNIKGTNIKFEPGQYARFTITSFKKTSKEDNMRPFSIASSPDNNTEIMIAIRMRNSKFKNSLKSMKLGTKVKVECPQGVFTLHEDSKRPAVFLAGGIGITPMRSIIEHAANHKLKHKIYLFYSNKTPDSTAFLNDLEDFAKNNKNLKIIPSVTEYDGKGWKYEKGRCSMAMIRKYIKNLNKPIYYIAGPPAMVQAFTEMLVDAKINRENIRTEDFTGY